MAESQSKDPSIVGNWWSQSLRMSWKGSSYMQVVVDARLRSIGLPHLATSAWWFVVYLNLVFDCFLLVALYWVSNLESFEWTLSLDSYLWFTGYLYLQVLFAHQYFQESFESKSPWPLGTMADKRCVDLVCWWLLQGWRPRIKLRNLWSIWRDGLKRSSMGCQV